MPNIEFEEGSKSYNNRYREIMQNQPKNSKMVNLLLKTGIVRSEKTANTVLSVIALICITLAMWMTFFAGSSSQTVNENRVSKDPSDMFVPQP